MIAIILDNRVATVETPVDEGQEKDGRKQTPYYSTREIATLSTKLILDAHLWKEETV